MIRRDPPECPGITGPLWRFLAAYGALLVLTGAATAAAAWLMAA
jgi:hypothetical protein